MQFFAMRIILKSAWSYFLQIYTVYLNFWPVSVCARWTKTPWTRGCYPWGRFYHWRKRRALPLNAHHLLILYWTTKCCFYFAQLAHFTNLRFNFSYLAHPSHFSDPVFFAQHLARVHFLSFLLLISSLLFSLSLLSPPPSSPNVFSPFLVSRVVSIS